MNDPSRIWSRGRWLLLALAILHQARHHWAADRFDSDRSYQIAAARSLVEGEGLTWPEWNPEDAASPVRRPLGAWPPLYSLLFAGGLALDGDPARVALAIDLVSLVVFFVAWLAIMELVGPALDGRAKLLVWIAWALVFNPLIKMRGAEVLAAALFSAGVALTLASLRSRRMPWLAAASGLSVAAAAAARYAYWPLVAVLPAALTAAALAIGPQRRLYLAAGIQGGTAAGLVAILALALRLWTGHATLLGHKAADLAGLHPGNLLRMCPFPACAIGLPEAWSFVTHELPLLGRIPENLLFWAVSPVLLAACVWPLMEGRRKLFERGPDHDPSHLAPLVLALAGSLVTVLTLGMLSYLSLRAPMTNEYWAPRGWTAVGEVRYFAPTFAFLAIAMAWSVVRAADLAAAHDRRRLRATLMGLVAAGLAVGAAGRLKDIAAWTVDHRRVWTRAVAVDRDDRLLQARILGHRGEGTAVLAPCELDWGQDRWMERSRWMAVLSGACPVDPAVVMEGRLRTGEPVVVMAIIPDDAKTASLLEWKGWIEKRRDFFRVGRLEGRWLYEASWPADKRP